MQINAQSAASSVWLEMAKKNNQNGSSVTSNNQSTNADRVTLSEASLALASGKSVQSEQLAYVWPTWPTKPGGVRPESS